MFPFLLLPFALALGLSTHQTPAPAQAAVNDSTAAANAAANAKLPVTIEFDNQAWEMATVYAVPDHGLPVRLGDVTPGSTARLVIPRNVVSNITTLNLVATRLARRGAVGSGPVTVSPGDTFNVSLSSNGLVSVLPGR